MNSLPFEPVSILMIAERARDGLYKQGEHDFYCDALNAYAHSGFDEEGIALATVQKRQTETSDTEAETPEETEIAGLALEFALYSLAKTMNYRGRHALFSEPIQDEARRTGGLNDLRSDVASCEIGLSGPIGTTDILVNKVRKSAQVMLQTTVASDKGPYSETINSKDYYDSFLRTAGHFATLQSRLDAHYPSTRTAKHVCNLLPELLEHFSKVSRILQLTDTHFKAVRHPVLAFNPEEAAAFVAEATEQGFTMSQVRTMAARAKPGSKFTNAREALKSLMQDTDIPVSMAREFAIDHANPEHAGSEASKRIKQLTKDYKEDPVIKPYDIQHYVRNNGVDHAKDELDAFKIRVLALHEKYPNDPLIINEVIRSAARRSRNPESFIAVIKKRFEDLCAAHPEVSIKALMHVARNFADPDGIVTRAKDRHKVDPYMGNIRRPRTTTSAVWHTILSTK